MTAAERVAAFVIAWRKFNNPGDTVYRVARDGQEFDLLVDDLAELAGVDAEDDSDGEPLRG